MSFLDEYTTSMQDGLWTEPHVHMTLEVYTKKNKAFAMSKISMGSTAMLRIFQNYIKCTANMDTSQI